MGIVTTPFFCFLVIHPSLSQSRNAPGHRNTAVWYELTLPKVGCTNLSTVALSVCRLLYFHFSLRKSTFAHTYNNLELQPSDSDHSKLTAIRPIDEIFDFNDESRKIAERVPHHATRASARAYPLTFMCKGGGAAARWRGRVVSSCVCLLGFSRDEGAKRFAEKFGRCSTSHLVIAPLLYYSSWSTCRAINRSQ